MERTRRVLVTGPNSDAVSTAAAAIGGEAGLTAVTAAVESVDSGRIDGGAADCLVWAGRLESDRAGALFASDVPVVAFGDGETPSPRAALLAGADDYVHSDGGGAVLAHRVRTLLDEQGDPTPARADGGAAVERRFRTIVEGATDPIYLKDRDGRYQYLNEAAASLFDAAPSDLVGETADALFGPEAARQIRRDDEAVLEHGESVTVETALEAEGGERVFQAEKFPYAPDGDVEGVAAIARDVTDHKRTERELERNERALRDLQRLASRRDLTLDEKLDRALEIGRERLGLPLGFLTAIDDDTQRIVAARGDHDELQPGASAPLSEAYCRKTIESRGLLTIEHASGGGWGEDPAYDRYGLECYLGGKLLVDGALYGTVCFGDTNRHDRSFSEPEETFIELLIEWMSYELERRENQRELERYGTIVESVDDGVYELDEEGRFTFVNPAMCELTGYDADELLGEHVTAVKDDDGETAAALEALLSGADTERSVESALVRRRGEPVPCEDNMTRLADAEGVHGVVGVVRDITEQKEHRERLSALVESSRTLMQARDRTEVAEMVARAVAEALGFDLTVVRLFDRDEERLVPAGTTDAAADRLSEPPAYDLGEGGPGEAFVDGQTVVIEDTSEVDDGRDRDVVESAIHLPMGVHGTISIGATEPDAFSDVDRQAAELLATSAAAATNRAKREQEVREARERVDALVDRINGLIQDTVEVLVQAATRDELESGVVDRLVATDPYAFAWIARPDVASETLEASAWAGDCPALTEAMDDLSIDRDDPDDPAALALAEEELRIVDDLADAPADGVHAVAADDLGSLIAVPLTYKDATYGVLTVYARDTDAFAERERVVLGALGRAVANAVNAIESGRILSTNRVVELEFTVDDADLLFSRLSAQTGGEIELTGSVYQSDGSLRLYAAATGADADDLLAVLDGADDVADANVIVDHDGEVLFEATVDDSLIELLADHGAVTQSVTASDGVARYTIELPYETEAREVFALVEGRYGRTDLVGYHEHERPVRTRQEFREAVTERFTDRQETAIRTAYHSGFFEWPRDVDGDELAESMDITRPTYHQHLRAAQRKVFDELFDAGTGRRRT